MSWDLNLNAEGTDPDRDDYKRRGLAGAEWAEKHITATLITMVKDTLKQSKTAAKREIDDVAVYAGVASRILNLLDNSIDGAIKEMSSKNKTMDKEKVEIQKTRILSHIIKNIVDEAEELRKM